MNEVVSTSARKFSKELRKFAFDSSVDFKKGLVSSVESQKTFWLPTDPVKTTEGDIRLPYRKMTVSFRADRDGNAEATYRSSYIYALTSVAERSLSTIPDHVMEEIRKEDDDDALELIETANPEDISESALITFETSDIDLDDSEIQVMHSYEIAVCDQSVYQQDDDDILYTSAGEYVPIPKIESVEGRNKMFIDERIPHEQLDMYDRIHTEIAFRALVDPFNEEYNAVISFDEAAHRMRAIMEILRKGVDVARLYDLR